MQRTLLLRHFSSLSRGLQYSGCITFRDNPPRPSFSSFDKTKIGASASAYKQANSLIKGRQPMDEGKLKGCIVSALKQSIALPSDKLWVQDFIAGKLVSLICKQLSGSCINNLHDTVCITMSMISTSTQFLAFGYSHVA